MRLWCRNDAEIPFKEIGGCKAFAILRRMKIATKPLCLTINICIFYKSGAHTEWLIKNTNCTESIMFCYAFLVFGKQIKNTGKRNSVKEIRKKCTVKASKKYGITEWIKHETVLVSANYQCMHTYIQLSWIRRANNIERYFWLMMLNWKKCVNF